MQNWNRCHTKPLDKQAFTIYNLRNNIDMIHGYHRQLLYLYEPSNWNRWITFYFIERNWITDSQHYSKHIFHVFRVIPIVRKMATLLLPTKWWTAYTHILHNLPWYSCRNPWEVDQFTHVCRDRSCPESIRCCRQCVIPLVWCQSVFDGWVLAEWLGRWLQHWAASGVFKIPELPVRHRHSPHEAIRS